jgi:uncharacterized protein YcfJ
LSTLKRNVMKKLLSVFTIAALMAACNTAPKVAPGDEARRVADSLRLAADTAGLAQFQQWKAQNEMMYANPYAMQNNAMAAGVAAAPVRTAAARRTYSRSYSSSSGNTARATQRRGWSKAAKGAVIGGVAGGAAGAIINKRNRVAGGVIGGVIGAAAGYGIGRAQDKRDGRY